MSGRISPCTFALWAEGCKRWDTEKKIVEVPEGVSIFSLFTALAASVNLKEHPGACD
jgi:hypothetical protein